MRVLLLAGTAEARELAQQLHGDGRFQVTSSLAGATRTPAPYPGGVRRGGFGGVAGFRAYLTRHRVQAVVDATHPFAAVMSQTAATVTDVPLLRLERPAWVAQTSDRWLPFNGLEAALSGLPPEATALLTVGASALTQSLPVAPRLILRMIEPPEGPLPHNAEALLARPPFDLKGELALLSDVGVTHLVTKNAGGARAKLDAAARLSLQVHMINRPAPPEPCPPSVSTPAAALDWLIDVANRTSDGATHA